MRKKFKRLAGVLAFGSLIAMFCCYFTGKSDGVLEIFLGLFLGFIGLASGLSVDPPDFRERRKRKEARIGREVREMRLQPLPSGLILAGILLGPIMVIFGLFSIVSDAVVEPGSGLAARIANTAFGGVEGSLECAKSFLCGIAACLMILLVITAVVSLGIVVYLNWYRLKLFVKSKVLHQEVVAHE